jgi:uncharacterized repeat protein (TIGR03943 family)
MRFDPRRTARTVVLAIWTGFFAWLWLSGELVRYIGPRTYWVVVFGAIALAIATLAHVATLRTENPSSLPLREVLGHILMVAPLLAVLIIPAAELGAQAASRKASSGGLVAAINRVAPTHVDEIGFAELNYASESEEYALATGIGAGRDVDLIGFATGTGESEGFKLTRFYISCCAADAIPYSVVIDPASTGADPKNDDWLHVKGVIEERDGKLVVVAESVRDVKAPDTPYLF